MPSSSSALIVLILAGVGIALPPAVHSTESAPPIQLFVDAASED